MTILTEMPFSMQASMVDLVSWRGGSNSGSSTRNSQRASFTAPQRSSRQHAPAEASLQQGMRMARARMRPSTCQERLAAPSGDADCLPRTAQHALQASGMTWARAGGCSLPSCRHSTAQLLVSGARMAAPGLQQAAVPG